MDKVFNSRGEPGHFLRRCGIHSRVDIDLLIQEIDYVTVEDELINVRDQTILDDGAVLFPVVSVFFLARFAVATVSMHQ